MRANDIIEEERRARRELGDNVRMHVILGATVITNARVEEANADADTVRLSVADRGSVTYRMVINARRVTALQFEPQSQIASVARFL